jgi:ATPase subunit of ABC transporter with duplicated ATPase domains
MPSSSLVAVQAAHLTFAHTDTVPVLEDAAFSLLPGWTGLVGENGAGKTTLLRLIAGELRPTSGQLRLDPVGTRIAWARQDVEVRDAAIDAFARAEDADAGRLRAMLRLDPAALTRWPTLSPGERRRWQLGAVVPTEPGVLLLDEPTNHLDAEARAWVIEALRGFRGAGLVVSHDRALLDALVARVWRLHDGGLRAWTGTYTEARAAWEAERADRVREQVRRREEHDRQRRLLDRQRRDAEAAARQRHAGRRMKTIHDHDQSSAAVNGKIERSGRNVGRRAAVLARRTAWAEAADGAVAVQRERGRAFSVGSVAPGRPWLLELGDPVMLPTGQVVRVPPIGRGDRIWLRGANGAGKTSLLRAILARLTIPVDRLLVLPQHTAEVDGLQALATVRRLDRDARGLVLSAVAALGVDPDRLLATEHPSPGETRKLLLAQGLGSGSWLLVLDEPENHLDLPSVERLEAALTAYPGALLLVSHDDRLAAAVTRTEWRLGVDGLT